MKISKLFTLCLLNLLLLLLIRYQSYSINNANELFEISFEELMLTNVQTGTLLSMPNLLVPAMVTTITSNDIEITPHRNIYDLIETYVPGAIFFTHYDGNVLGVRGIISDRNNKILIMINNRISNQKARSGAISELENWDLRDIDRIEIIRGPGSVTYGPGAIECVINIVTKSSSTNEANDMRVNYIQPYNSKGISAKISHSFSDYLSLFASASIQQTQGYSPENAFVIMYNDWTWEKDKMNNIFQDYMGDYLGVPQKKFHLQLDILDNTKFWARYTNSGSPSNGAYAKTKYQIALDTNNQVIEGGLRNPSIVSNEHFVAAFENEFQINQSSSLSSLISYDIENNSRSYGYFIYWRDPDDPSQRVIDEIQDQRSLRNMYNNFSESELLGTFVYRSILSDKFRFASGVVLSLNSWGSPWGQPDNMIRMGDKSNIISGTDSPIYGDSRYFGVDSASAVFVGSGWSTFMYSVFWESEYKVDSKLSTLISVRLDKDSYSDYLFSPRLALVYQIDSKNVVKLVGQQSNRMNTAEELFFQNKANLTTKPETLNTVELMYSTIATSDLLIELSAYYNNIDILSWYDPDRSTRTTGNLEILGSEIELSYKYRNVKIGFNQSLTKMLNWKLAENVLRSGISYSDYIFEYGNNKTYGYGNNLNNWSNLSSKVYCNLQLFDDDLTFHLNARLYYGFEGAKDGLNIVNTIIQNTDEEEKIQKILTVMKEQNFYDYDLRTNASVNLKLLDKALITLFAMNFTNFNNNYRYKYEAGNKADNYFFRMNVLEEPFTYGLSLSYDF